MLGDAPDAFRRFEENVEQAERAFQKFRAQQTTHEGKVTHKDKQDLRQRLEMLDAELDSYLAAEYGIATENYRTKTAYEEAFARWKASHGPFHWFVEFFGIMHTGGFDVIIGNPPYVEYSALKNAYSI